MNERGEVALVQSHNHLITALSLPRNNLKGISFVLLLLKHAVEHMAPVEFEGEFKSVLLSDFILRKHSVSLVQSGQELSQFLVRVVMIDFSHIVSKVTEAGKMPGDHSVVDVERLVGATIDNAISKLFPSN